MLQAGFLAYNKAESTSTNTPETLLVSPVDGSYNEPSSMKDAS